jgi:hypothetical protein
MSRKDAEPSGMQEWDAPIADPASRRSMRTPDGAVIGNTLRP